MSTKKASLPSELPATPDGYTKRMGMHLNFGEEGGAATYAIHDPDGNDTGIVYQYDTRRARLRPAKTGFHVPAAKTAVFKTWAELSAAWPEIVEKLGATGAAS